MKSDFLDQLMKVFPPHPVPRNILLDERDNSEFSEDIRLQFASKSWPSVTLENWANTAGVEVMPFYMTPDAFHYYLPSLLLVSSSAGEYIDWGLKAILPNNNSREPKGDWWGSYFACFSDDQKKFVQEYILSVLEKVPECSEEEYLAQIALEKIWL